MKDTREKSVQDILYIYDKGIMSQRDLFNYAIYMKKDDKGHIVQNYEKTKEQNINLRSPILVTLNANDINSLLIQSIVDYDKFDKDSLPFFSIDRFYATNCHIYSLYKTFIKMGIIKEDFKIYKKFLKEEEWGEKVTDTDYIAQIISESKYYPANIYKFVKEVNEVYTAEMYELSLKLQNIVSLIRESFGKTFTDPGTYKAIERINATIENFTLEEQNYSLESKSLYFNIRLDISAYINMYLVKNLISKSEIELIKKRINTEEVTNRTYYQDIPSIEIKESYFLTLPINFAKKDVKNRFLDISEDFYNIVSKVI